MRGLGDDEIRTLVAHAQDALVEVDGDVDIRHRQYQVIQSFDHAQCLSSR